MGGKKGCLAGAAWVLAVLVAALAGCHRTPDEQRVRDAIEVAVEAAREGSPGGFAEVLAEDFDGNAGRFDRRRLVGMLRLMRLRGERLTVVLGPVSVEPRGERYVATFTVTLGSGGSRLLPERLGVHHVSTAWRLEGGEWRCYRATWERAFSATGR